MNSQFEKQLELFKNVSKRFVFIAIAIISLIIILYAGFQIYTNYIWMDTVGFSTIYTTILSSKVLLGLSGFVLFFLLTFATLYWIRTSYMKQFSPAQLPIFVVNKMPSFWLIAIGSLVIGIMGSLIVQGVGWEPTLKLFNFSEFGQEDPFFGMDISFYVFVLPFIQFVIYTLLNLFIFFIILQLAAYIPFNLYRLNRHAQVHLAVTVGAIGILFAAIHYLGRFETLLSNQVNLFQTSVVHGLSYTDDLINLPKAYVLAAVAIIVTIWVVVLLFRGKIQSILTPIIVYIAFIIVGQVAAVVVQNFIVSPNEFAREEPYLEHNLNFTRAAYDLDNIEERENPGNMSLDQDMIGRNELTLENVRLNDSRPLLDIYNQLQTFRTYYKFNDMDIDRYEIDGEYEQVFVGARELSTDDLPEQAQTWVNKNLRYTHGYGVAMSHVNKVTAQGQPEYMLRNIPVDGDIDIERPQIYFGEEPYPNVIVKTKVDEFDYPTGEANETNRYEEDTGIPLQGFNKLLFALKEGSIRILVSDQLTDESLLLKTRNISERVNEIAPFFTYDGDPYIFVRDDGSLAWIIDAYVTAENYPYSEKYGANNNYIRNSVKVTVDAYTGDVDFYIVDEEDPLIQTYAKMFPDLFTEEIPEDVQAHFRYPVDLFKIQTAMYGTYHMSNLEVFYNREDYWEFPTEMYFNQDIEMDPYYITMKLPEYEQEEFILMRPFTPRNRQNMISWMGVRNDGDHYGEIFVYRFPKQRNIYGPQQIENRINQDSYISQQLNLWSQGGSEVIRGNLLVIPIEDTVLYVEPVYIESSNETSLPEVKQVIMAYDDYIVMEETFDESLERILELVESGAAPDITQPIDEDMLDEEGLIEDPGLEEDPIIDEEESVIEEDAEDLPILSADEQLQEISELFDAYQQAISDRNWAEAGELMEEIERRLSQ